MRRFLVAIAVVVFVLTLVFASVAGAQEVTAGDATARAKAAAGKGAEAVTSNAVASADDHSSGKATTRQSSRMMVRQSKASNDAGNTVRAQQNGAQNAGNAQYTTNIIINIPNKPLPNTGGPWLPLAGGVSLLLVGVGLAVRVLRP
jgi:hypothetical protein